MQHGYSPVQRKTDFLVGASAQPIRAAHSDWCNSRNKRLMDITVALLGLLVLSPLILGIGIATYVTSGGPVIFRQWRTGRYGRREFQLLKFRTMVVQGFDAPAVTRAGDPRVTAIGKWLRRLKLDELPQLVNVVRGEMSLVGPRPDLNHFWLQASESTRQALTLAPGLTGAASIVFRDEESLLAKVEPQQIDTFYVERLLPLKARLDLEYAAESTFVTDCRILARTFVAALGNGPTANVTRTLNEQLSR